MKNIIVVIIAILLVSCNNDDTQYEIINVAIPITMSKAEFRTSVEISEPQAIQQAGKIYAYNNYIFISDKLHGVHIIDNSNPVAPQSVAYIKIPGNEDIAIKNDFLFADSAVDLVVFDISNINDIEILDRLEDVFYVYNEQIPSEAVYADYESFNSENEVIVGWDLEERRVEFSQDDDVFVTLDGSNEASNGNVGVGGSLARFQIVNDYLYTVGTEEMNIFNIQNLAQPNLENNFYSGWNIETMFYYEDHLYLGSTDGMYIYGLENPTQPEYKSLYSHWTGCDPVVVDGNMAYLTLRGGNLCGQEESILEVIDVSDKQNPHSVAVYSMDNPYGLGYRNQSLFVCDGDSGLKVFDKTNPLDLQMTQNFTAINAQDVIPLENSLVMIGNNALMQYQYVGDQVTLISSFNLN